MNRLEKEKSPYLLQHKDNPVDWYPWCSEAFDKAKHEDKPVLLSVGYSTCHWCHVMAHESFEDEETARILNKNFICIKVDREAADRQMRFVAGRAEEYPAGHCFALLSIDKALRPSRELIVCGEQLPYELAALRGNDLNILFKSSSNAEHLARCAPFTAHYPVPERGTSGYLCENGTCRRSDTDLKDLII